MGSIYDWQGDEFHEPQPTEGFAQLVFNRLTRLVKAKGGGMLPETCEPESIPELTLPPSVADAWDLSPEAYTCGCTGGTRLSLPYEKEDGSAGFVTACAVCDHGASWPVLRPAHA